jgi:CDP-paratose 2-epimerase
MTKSLEDPFSDFCTNALGTLNILEATRVYSPKAFFAFSSTNKVYGDLKNLNYLEKELRYEILGFERGLNEELPIDFSTPYGCSKGAADQYVRDWSRCFGLKTTVFRHSSIYGGRQFASKDQGWIGWFCKQALNQSLNLENSKEVLPFTISGNGKQVRDVLHAQDLVSLYKSAFKNIDSASGEIFNIGGGVENSLSILELFEILKDILGLKDIKYIKIPRRKSDQDYFVADIRKAQKLLQWTPKVSVKEGLINMIHWSKNI